MNRTRSLKRRILKRNKSSTVSRVREEMESRILCPSKFVGGQVADTNGDEICRQREKAGESGVSVDITK